MKRLLWRVGIYFWWICAESDAPTYVYEFSKEIAKELGIKPFKNVKLSSRYNVVNAVVVGLRCKKLVISKALLELVEGDELKALLLHEYAHCRYRHSLKILFTIIALSIPIAIATLYILTTIEDTALAVVLSILFYSFSYTVLTIIVRAVSRRYELEADLFAVKHLNNPRAYLSLLTKLAIGHSESNLFINKLFRSHPTLDERIRNVMEYLHSSGEM